MLSERWLIDALENGEPFEFIKNLIYKGHETAGYIKPCKRKT